MSLMTQVQNCFLQQVKSRKQNFTKNFLWCGNYFNPPSPFTPAVAQYVVGPQVLTEDFVLCDKFYFRCLSPKAFYFSKYPRKSAVFPIVRMVSAEFFFLLRHVSPRLLRVAWLIGNKVSISLWLIPLHCRAHPLLGCAPGTCRKKSTGLIHLLPADGPARHSCCLSCLLLQHNYDERKQEQRCWS